MNFHPKILRRVLREQHEKALARELREYLVMGASREVAEVYAQYCREVEAWEARKRRFTSYLGYAAVVAVSGGLAWYIVGAMKP